MSPSIRKRHWFAPEVVQTSSMDCGVASLKCALEGFGISASYGRLREACQTDVDGTSIDVIEDVARKLGLEAEQVIVPRDHVLLNSAELLPAIAIVRLPNGFAHFVVAWRRHRETVQVMDPARGRLWAKKRDFEENLYLHTIQLSAQSWREWAGSADFLEPLESRLRRADSASGASLRIEKALVDPSWRGLATLDAAARLVNQVVDSGGLRRGCEAGSFIERILNSESQIPLPYWSVRPLTAGPEDAELLSMEGAVLVKLSTAEEKPESAGDPGARRADAELSPELAAALKEPPSRPGLELFRLLKKDGRLAPTILLGALALAACGTVIEALLFRSLLNIGRELTVAQERISALFSLVALVTALTLLELPIASGVNRIGRRLETRLRVAFLEKIPRLADRYLQSRLTSDMAARAQSVDRLRLFPALASQLVRTLMIFLATAVGLIWLNPASTPAVLAVVVISTVLPIATQQPLTEGDLRVRNFAGSLSRYHLDALLGLMAVRAHGAEQPIRREHESLLVEWARTGLAFQRTVISVDAIQLFTGSALAAWLLYHYLLGSHDVGSILLLAYWSLSIPFLGLEIARLARQYPAQRNIALRLMEPLGALEQPGSVATRLSDAPNASKPGARQITFDGVRVIAGGHTLLEGVDLKIAAGSHVAIVGRSGAGKSSFVGVLLGWHRPAEGEVRIDDLPLQDCLEELRSETVWVDPAVQLWNRSLLANLRYGSPDTRGVALDQVLDSADLREVLQNLPDGLQSVLGEGGGLVSGGEGQRIRLGRGFMRSHARLIILDEPFRGLTRDQ